MSKVLTEILDYTKIDKEEYKQGEQEFLKKLAVSMDNLINEDEQIWEYLLVATKHWLNSAIQAILENKTIPIISGMHIALKGLPKKQEIIIKEFEKNEIEKRVNGIKAFQCERGKFYEIDIKTGKLVAECIRIAPDVVVFEDNLSDRYTLFPHCTVVPRETPTKPQIYYDVELNKNKQKHPSDVIPDLTLFKPEKKSKRRVCPTRYARIELCKNPDVSLEVLMVLLDKAGFVNISRKVIATEMYLTKDVIAILKELGKYKELPNKEDLNSNENKIRE